MSAVPIKAKGEATGEIIKWIRKFNHFSKWRVKRLQTDNAMEFARSNELAKFLGSEGIVHKKKVPIYEHHQNEAVERVNRKLSEMTRAFLHSKRLPKYLWSYGFWQAAYVFNWLVHCGKDTTPIERVLGTKPLLEMLRVFGCNTYAYDHKHKKRMVPYATKLRHFGVAFGSKGWLLWYPKTRKVTTAISVQFDENKLYVHLAEQDGEHFNEGTILAIECVQLGDFTLGNKLDVQDALVEKLDARDTYGNNSPTFSKAMRSVAEAMAEEQKVLEEMGLWVESTPPGNKKKILRSRWLLGTNWDMEGNIKRCKARIIVGGHWQEKNVNYDKTFAPTPTFSLPRTALTVAAKLGWSVASFDVKTVSLHSPIDEDVWVVPPPGNKVMPGKV
jgi:hypothetical protein